MPKGDWLTWLLLAGLSWRHAFKDGRDWRDATSCLKFVLGHFLAYRCTCERLPSNNLESRIAVIVLSNRPFGQPSSNPGRAKGFAMPRFNRVAR
jgi:hypothetical protein